MNFDRHFKFFATVIVILLLLAYSNHFDNDFHFDDSHTIQNNIYIRNIKNIPLFFKDGSTISTLPANQAYRPVLTTSLAIDYWLGDGLKPFYFHLSTFVLYLLQGVLVFLLFYAIINRSIKHKWNHYFALFIAAFYWLNTVNAETINYIIARSDSLSTQGVLAGLVLYIYSDFCRKYFLYLIPVIIGTLAKPTAVMFAPLFIVYDLLFEKQFTLYSLSGKNKQNNILVNTIFKAIPAIVVCAFLYFFINKMTPKTWVPGGYDSFRYIISQPFVTLHYFQLFFVPTQLSADTDWSTLSSISDSRFLIGILFVLALISVAVYCLRETKTLPVSFGIAWYFIGLAPTAFVPLAEVMNDHRMFFPNIGLALAAGWVVALLMIRNAGRYESNANKIILTVFLCFVVLGGYSYGVYQRNKVWHSEESLWMDVSIKSPKNGRGLMNYGLTLMAKGNYTEAKKYFEMALPYVPYYSYLHVNLAVLNNAMGNAQQAEKYFLNALQYAPGNPSSYTFYADFLSKQRRFSEAEVMLKRALQLTDANINTRYALMEIYYKTGRWNELNLLAEQTLQIYPNDATTTNYLKLSLSRPVISFTEDNSMNEVRTPENLLNQSLILYQTKEYKKCIEVCEQAIKLKPDYAEAYNNICSAYNELKQYDKAAEACNKALKINPGYQLAKNNLDWAVKSKK